MGYLKYKGYTGSVEYSEEDKCLFGKVQGMSKDSITYEGQTVEELTKDFEGAVDDYLALCEEKGVVFLTFALHLRFIVEQQWPQAKQASPSMHSSKMPLPEHWD